MRGYSKLIDEIAGIPVRDLARDFGTPTYIYDAATPRNTRKKSVGMMKSSAPSNTAPTTIQPHHGIAIRLPP